MLGQATPRAREVNHSQEWLIKKIQFKTLGKANLRSSDEPPFFQSSWLSNLFPTFMVDNPIFPTFTVVEPFSIFMIDKLFPNLQSWWSFFLKLMWLTLFIVFELIIHFWNSSSARVLWNFHANLWAPCSHTRPKAYLHYYCLADMASCVIKIINIHIGCISWSSFAIDIFPYGIFQLDPQQMNL